MPLKLIGQLETLQSLRSLDTEQQMYLPAWGMMTSLIITWHQNRKWAQHTRVQWKAVYGFVQSLNSGVTLGPNHLYTITFPNTNMMCELIYIYISEGLLVNLKLIN